MNINNRNRIIILVSFFTALTAIGAYIKIPLPQIPITLQTFFVIMSGNILGFKFGSLSQLLYLILGLIGIPIFAYGGGIAYIFQPSFGYLLGYPVGAFTIGILLKLFLPDLDVRQTSITKLVGVLFISDVFGVVIIFIFGLCYLYINLRFGLYLNLEQFNFLDLNWQNAFKMALFLLVPIDLMKVFLAVWLTIGLKRISLFVNILVTD